ncbi:hypothetical protein BG004_002161 [Podila humilis]|nr:hypothetical protein BG004_002161 [Podila humilis]
METFLDWYTRPENYRRLQNKNPANKVKDMQFAVARVINDANVAEGLNWTWKDVKNTIAYVKKQYRKAKTMKDGTRGSFVSLPEDTVRARMLKVCPEFDRLDPILSTNAGPSTHTGSDTELDTITPDNQDGVGDDNFDQEALDNEVNCFPGGDAAQSASSGLSSIDTDAEEWPARKRRKYSKTKAYVSIAAPIAAAADAVRSMTEKQIQHLDSYRSEIRQREESIDKRERELNTEIMERDAAARKRLEEELMIKKERFIDDLAKEKEEFHKDMAVKKEEFHKDMSQKKEEYNKDMAQKKKELQIELDKVRSERKEHFVALAEISVLRRQLEAMAPNKGT